MSSRVTRSTSRAARLIASAWLLAAGLTTSLPLIASAQFAQPLGAQSEPLPLGPQGNPLPPPPGDGMQPLPIISGDTGAALPPPADQADTGSGSQFSAGTGSDRTVVRIYRQTNGGPTGASRGQRMVQTLRPDQLSDKQIDAINGILGINMRSGEQSIDVPADDQKLAQIQDILAAYPQTTSGADGRKKIVRDQPGQGYPKPENKGLWDYQGPLPTVKTFARWLVILAVVSATIWMALAAWSMVLGHPYGGSRVISSAAGLILILMAFTIYKIVQLNTFKGNNSNPAISQNRPFDAQVSDAYVNPTNTPKPPGTSRSNPSRFGVPLEPLGDAGNP